MQHVGDVEWHIQPHSPEADTVDRRDEFRRAVLRAVADAEWQLTETQVLQAVGGKKEVVRQVFAELVDEGAVLVESRARTEGKREVRRDVCGLPP